MHTKDQAVLISCIASIRNSLRLCNQSYHTPFAAEAQGIRRHLALRPIRKPHTLYIFLIPYLAFSFYKSSIHTFFKHLLRLHLGILP